MKTYLPFLNVWFDASPSSFAFVSGVLPPAVSGLFGFFLPIIMRWLTKVDHRSALVNTMLTETLFVSIWAR